MKLAILVVSCVLVGGACSDSNSSGSAGKDAPDATSVARTLKTSVASVKKIVTITEDNDPNDKIGRPGGYTSAAVLYDNRTECRSLGVDCGATIEVYSSADDAKARSEFIQSTQKAAKILGSEYNYLDGAVLLRVSGHIKPSVAKDYEGALGDG